MEEQLSLRLNRIDIITEMQTDAVDTMYVRLEVDTDQSNTKYILAERCFDAGGVARSIKLFNLTPEEIEHCYSIGISDR